MDKQRDLELILRSRVPIIVIETHDEARMLADPVCWPSDHEGSEMDLGCD